MHVLRLTPHFYFPQLADKGWPIRFDAIGGMQTQSFRLTRALSELDVRQTILTLKLPDVPNPWGMDRNVSVHGVRIPILPIRSKIRGMVDLNISWALGCLRHLISKRFENVDLIHLHASGVVEPLLTGYLAARILKVPLVVTVHCSILATYKPLNFTDRLIRPIAMAIEKAVLKFSARTVFLTNKTHEHVLAAGWLSKEKTCIIPDIVDAVAFAEKVTQDAQTAFLQRFPKLRNKRIVSYVGRIAREKGWPMLFDLMSQLQRSDVHLLICGDGNEREELESTIKHRGMSGQVTVTGYLSQDVVPVAMSVSDVIVLVSHHEEFGGVIIEGMSVGTPSVAFAVGGVPSVIDDGVTGFTVEHGDIAEMAKRVTLLLDDPTLRSRQAEAGLQAVASRFGALTSAKTMLDAYHCATAQGADVR